MTDHDWQQCWEKMGDLWPKQTGTMNDEQQAGYRRCVERYTAVVVIPELRWFYDNSKYMPRPAELRSRMQSASSGSLGRSIKTESDPQEVVRFVAGLTDEQIMNYMQPTIDRYPKLLGDKTASFWRHPWHRSIEVYRAAGMDDHPHPAGV